jgi:polyisoprenyl-phosphate glycosyltransferase
MSKNLSLVIIAPVYNEEAVIGKFQERIAAVLDSMQQVDAQILYVVDRCTDHTIDVLRSIVQRDRRVRVLTLSSRFGHQMSLLAGIDHSLAADVLIMMDSDLQHPPELIPTLLAHFESGADVVYTVRTDSADVGIIRKAMGDVFYRFLNSISDVDINPNAADFRLISQRVAVVLATRFSERNMFLRGLFSWIGFKQVGVEYIAERRFAGISKYSLSRMIRLAASGILSFSTKPLQIGLFAGAIFAALAFLMTGITVANYFLESALPSGWTTIVTLLLIFNGVQLIVLGILGAYVGGIYEEVKMRPRYIIDEDIRRPLFAEEEGNDHHPTAININAPLL